MTSMDQGSSLSDQSEIWSMVKSRLALRDFLGARGLLHMASNHEGTHGPLSRVLIEMLTNYHGYLAQLGYGVTAPLDSLVPNTPSYRSLPSRVLLEVDEERNRLVQLIERVRTLPKQRLAFLLHQVLYWLSMTDGIRVNLWTYQGIQALEMESMVAPSLQVFRSHLRSELLSALDLAPRSAAALKSEWTKSNYEGIEEFRIAVTAYGVTHEEVDAFIPRLDAIFRLDMVRSVH